MDAVMLFFLPAGQGAWHRVATLNERAKSESASMVIAVPIITVS
jgi:hypothetical protein